MGLGWLGYSFCLFDDDNFGISSLESQREKLRWISCK